jgi:competence protein ComEC
MQIACLIAVVTGWILCPPSSQSLTTTTKSYNGQITLLSLVKRNQYGCSWLAQAHDKTLLLESRKPDLIPGDILWVSGKIEPHSSNGQAYWLRKGVVGRLKLTDEAHHIQHGPSFWKTTSALHRSFIDFSSKFLPQRIAGLINALCFNDRSTLSLATQQSLLATGTIHIVSTSGLHVVLVAGLLMAAIRLLCLPRSVNLFLLALTLLIYVGSTGFQAPAVRAWIMLMIGLMAFLFKKEADPISALSLAGITYCIFSPASIFEIGFQLSFVCTGALILYMPAIHRQKIPTPSQFITTQLEQILKASFVAFAASAPILAFHFSQIPTASILANILLVPFIALLMTTVFLAWLISLVFVPVAVGLIQLLVAPLSGWTLMVVEFLGSQAWSSLKVQTFSGYWVALLYLLVLMLGRFKARGFR